MTWTSRARGWLARLCAESHPRRSSCLGVESQHARTGLHAAPQGTLTHMAPEVLLDGRASKASDVYAFGITLWELFTGDHAFKGVPKTLLGHQVTVEHRSARPPLPRTSSSSHATAGERTRRGARHCSSRLSSLPFFSFGFGPQRKKAAARARPRRADADARRAVLCARARPTDPVPAGAPTSRRARRPSSSSWPPGAGTRTRTSGERRRHLATPAVPAHPCTRQLRGTWCRGARTPSQVHTTRSERRPRAPAHASLSAPSSSLMRVPSARASQHVVTLRQRSAAAPRPPPPPTCTQAHV